MPSKAKNLYTLLSRVFLAILASTLLMQAIGASAQELEVASATTGKISAPAPANGPSIAAASASSFEVWVKAYTNKTVRVTVVSDGDWGGKNATGAIDSTVPGLARKFDLPMEGGQQKRLVIAEDKFEIVQDDSITVSGTVGGIPFSTTALIKLHGPVFVAVVNLDSLDNPCPTFTLNGITDPTTKTEVVVDGAIVATYPDSVDTVKWTLTYPRPAAKVFDIHFGAWNARGEQKTDQWFRGIPGAGACGPQITATPTASPSPTASPTPTSSTVITQTASPSPSPTAGTPPPDTGDTPTPATPTMGVPTATPGANYGVNLTPGPGMSCLAGLDVSTFGVQGYKNSNPINIDPKNITERTIIPVASRDWVNFGDSPAQQYRNLVDVAQKAGVNYRDPRWTADELKAMYGTPTFAGFYAHIVWKNHGEFNFFVDWGTTRVLNPSECTPPPPPPSNDTVCTDNPATPDVDECHPFEKIDHPGTPCTTYWVDLLAKNGGVVTTDLTDESGARVTFSENGARVSITGLFNGKPFFKFMAHYTWKDKVIDVEYTLTPTKCVVADSLPNTGAHAFDFREVLLPGILVILALLGLGWVFRDRLSLINRRALRTRR